MSTREKKLIECVKELISDLEALALCGFPPPGAWTKISKDVEKARAVIKEE